jgi:NAD(P)-dependent dehydrogenase (short-subunit alcohol dehydrogenase family)
VGKIKVIMNIKKTAVVIGATGNLGSAIVEALEKAGYEIGKSWTGVDHPDATLAASYENLPPRIDMAVYAAGTNVVKPVHELSEEEWDEVMSVNVRGAFLFARAAFTGLKAARGVFVTISSINAVFPYPNRAAYSTSKAAIEGLTRQLAVEWGEYGISTHAIRLGPLNKLMKATRVNQAAIFEAVKKRMPQHELIPPAAVANYIVALGAGGAPWVTGTVIDFDAGFSLNIYPL